MTKNTTPIVLASPLRRGMRDGLPIALGYFAVSFSLGIAAKNAGLNIFQGFLASLLNNASAGEAAGFMLIAANASYLEVAILTFITNCRYLLMSCSLSQRFAPHMPFFHRFLIGFDVTDEIFAISVAHPYPLPPRYTYGAMLMALPGWSVGTALGIAMGNILPQNIVSALSVALYGMFIAIIIPPARKNRILALLVTASFAASLAFSLLPYLRELSEGMRTIILTLSISAIAAILFPIDNDEEEGETHEA